MDRMSGFGPADGGSIPSEPVLSLMNLDLYYNNP